MPLSLDCEDYISREMCTGKMYEGKVCMWSAEHHECIESEHGDLERICRQWEESECVVDPRCTWKSDQTRCVQQRTPMGWGRRALTQNNDSSDSSFNFSGLILPLSITAVGLLFCCCLVCGFVTVGACCCCKGQNQEQVLPVTSDKVEVVVPAADAPAVTQEKSQPPN